MGSAKRPEPVWGDEPCASAAQYAETAAWTVWGARNLFRNLYRINDPLGMGFMPDTRERVEEMFLQLYEVVRSATVVEAASRMDIRSVPIVRAREDKSFQASLRALGVEVHRG